MPITGLTLTAVQKEANWLAAYNPADGLPALLIANGGPFKIVQAYWRRQPNMNAPSLYVLRRRFSEERSANYRTIRTHHFVARIRWPILASEEQAQIGLDTAIETVMARIRGLPGDHTHGGAFLSVGEGVEPVDPSGRVEGDFSDPEQAIAAKHPLQCDITYSADDFEVTQ